jgi:SAM-dependent methyltransferase
LASDRVRAFSELASNHQPFDVSDARAMAALRRAEDEHFWHRSRNEFIAMRLRRLGVTAGQRFLDLGCGGGCVSAHLSSLGIAVVGVDGHRDLLTQAAARAPEATFWLHDLARGVDDLPQEPFDAAGLFDVVEHLESPVRALEAACSRVVSRGLVVGTVPAMMSLWSRADEQAGHRTRYDAVRLRRLIEAVRGCEVVEVEPFHRALVPLLWVRRRVVARRQGVAAVSETNFRVPPWPLNEGMLWLLRTERALGRAASRLTVHGASLWFALRKA